MHSILSLFPITLLSKFNYVSHLAGIELSLQLKVLKKKKKPKTMTQQVQKEKRKKKKKTLVTPKKHEIKIHFVDKNLPK